MDGYQEQSSIIALVDLLLEQALKERVSDIHAEPYHDHLAIRFRIDGLLYPRHSLPEALIAPFVARIKIISHLNIAEKRVPQDGRFSYTHKNQTIDIRVSSFPSIFGEKLVLRLLNRAEQQIDLEHLGFEHHMLEQFRQLLKKSSGFLLVSGPTGSGKTTTLYAALKLLNTPYKHIITLEDPVEYRLQGITQGHIHTDKGFTFEKGMRALLRQDPDIVMIGEIRDKQTAQIAIEAALTGHLVLSTLHTDDAVGAVVRLIDMGVEPFLINAALSGILAQRLVRRLCDHCKNPLTSMPSVSLKGINKSLSKAYTAAGCSACLNVGMKGRLGVFELLVPSQNFQELVAQKASRAQLLAQALQDGLIELVHDGIDKVSQGLVEVEELWRVLI